MREIGYKKFRVGDSFVVYDTTTHSIVRLPENAWRILDRYLRTTTEGSVRPADPLSDPTPPDDGSAFLHRARTRRGMFQPFFQKDFSAFVDRAGITAALSADLGALGLGLTDRCNQRCKYCVYSGAYAAERTHGSQQMTWKVARKSVDYYMARASRTKRPTVTFYGGEPFLNWDVLTKVASYLRDHYRSADPDIEVATNLTLLTAEKLRFLVAHRVRLQVSVDGPPSVHDASRVFANGRGTFRTVLSRLSWIEKSDPRYFATSVALACTVDKHGDPVDVVHFLTEEETLRALPAAFGALRESAVDGITVSPETRDLYDERMDALLAEYAREEARPHNAAYHRTFHHLFWSVFGTLAARRPGPAVPATPPNSACIPGVARLFVATDGRFYTCEKFSIDGFSIGDCERGIDEERVHGLLKTYAEWCDGLCQSCWAYRLCSQCFLHAIEGERITRDQKARSCAVTKHDIGRALERFVSLWENEPPEAHSEGFSLHGRVREERLARLP